MLMPAVVTNCSYFCWMFWKKSPEKRFGILKKNLNLQSHLVKSVDLLSIGHESHKASGQVNQTANNQILLAKALLRTAD